MEEERLYDVYAIDEDIKILENLQNRTKPIAEDLETAVCSIDEQLAIRNLIETYRKQEEIIKTYNAISNDYMPNDVKIVIADREYFNNGILKENYIPKSKIKEKIEEYKQEADEETNIEAFSKIDALEELLEEE